MKGRELDKQIYKEGDATWGLKEGFLDVEDVKNSLKELQDDVEKSEREICNGEEDYAEFERGYKIANKNLMITLRIVLGEKLLVSEDKGR